MVTTRAEQLNKLASVLPGANPNVVQGLKGARDAQLQQAVQQTSATGPAVAQQLGTAQTAALGAVNVQAAQQNQTQRTQMGELGLSEQSRGVRQQAFNNQTAVNAKQQEYATRLNNIDNNLKNQLLDKQLSFQADKSGAQLLNERQLADWAVVNAKSKEQLKNYQQMSEQASQRQLQIMEAATKKLAQVLEQGYVRDGKPLDQQTKIDITKKKQQIDLDIQAKKNKAANRSAIFGAAGTIAGAGIGTLIAPGAGTVAGAAIGGGVGTAASGTPL